MPKPPKVKKYGYAVKRFGAWDEGGFFSIHQPVRAKNPAEALIKIKKYARQITSEIPPIKLVDWAKIQAKRREKDNALFKYPEGEDTDISNSELRDKINQSEGWSVAGQFDGISSGQSLAEQNTNALFIIEQKIRKDRPDLAYDIRKHLLKAGYTKKEILKGYHKDRGLGI